ncbi:Myb-like DNA-binding domain containing protein [Histomonas meleagridis]|uniref:Myb-like DNA-binding domain containing protein n=1 Tax=Histomonas meleagridis TaxID=135588 RepID=UPI00355A0BFE|nr:Myb-like DNA-binding domain containing protein [Histomonas meleagridis]KAH0801225.1 Myb-like DNA-binding domain containing protein [Histomonas meleagridis]
MNQQQIPQPTSIQEPILDNSARISVIRPNDIIRFLRSIQKYSVKRDKFPWSNEEDSMLVAAGVQFGAKGWDEIAKFVPTRSETECRIRWGEKADPGNIRRDPFEPVEDIIIIESQKEVGNRWTCIAKKLPGRDPGAIKHRWYSKLRYLVGEQYQIPVVAPPKKNRPRGNSKKGNKAAADPSTQEVSGQSLQDALNPNIQVSDQNLQELANLFT